MRTLMIAATLVLIATSTHAQVTCQRIGQQTYCSNGVTANQIGNFTYINPPATYSPPPVYTPPPVFMAPQPTPYQWQR